MSQHENTGRMCSLSALSVSLIMAALIQNTIVQVHAQNCTDEVTCCDCFKASVVLDGNCRFVWLVVLCLLCVCVTTPGPSHSYPHAFPVRRFCPTNRPHCYSIVDFGSGFCAGEEMNEESQCKHGCSASLSESSSSTASSKLYIAIYIGSAVQYYCNLL